VYSGPSTSFSVSGRGTGTYYYRVRAVNSQGSSLWTTGANGCVVSLTSPGLLVQAGPGNPGSSAEAPGAAGVRMLHLELSAGQLEAIRLQGVTVRATGSGNDATELGAITLWRDTDGNGFVDMGEAQAAAGTFAADNGTVTFAPTAEPAIAAGTTAWYLVTADLRATVMPGSTFQLDVSPAADVTAQGWSSAAAAGIAGTDVWGGVVSVATSGAGSLQLSRGACSPGPGQVPAPAAGVPMLQVALAASSLEGVQVSRVRVASTGTGDESKGVTVRLYLDVNGDGQATASDVLLGTAPLAFDDGGVAFTGLTLSVPAGNRATLLVTYDFGGDRSVGTYTTAVDANADVEAAGSTSGLGILASGAPVSGSAQEVVGRGDMQPVFFIGSCGGPAGPANGLAWLLLAACLAGLRALRRKSPVRIR
jgi:hypothetical protein